MPESIECDAANIVARKIIKGALINEEGVGLCQKYKCSRNSSTTIKKELEPLKAIKCEASKLNRGDCLRAEDLFFLAKGSKRFRITKVNKSGRHKAQTMDTNVYTYAEIIKPFVHIIHALEKKELALKEKVKELK